MSSQTFASIAAVIVIFVGIVSLLGGSALRGYQLAQVMSQNQEVADQVENSDDGGGGNFNPVNPEEVANILGYIGDNVKDYGILLKRLNKVKLPGIEPYRAVVSEMLAQIKKAREILTNQTASDEEKQEVLSDYREISWEVIQEAGTAADLIEQLPKAVKFISSLSKLVNTFSQSPQLAGLIGLDVAQLQTTVSNTVGAVNQLNALITSGNLPEAVEYVRQEGEGGPGNNIETLYYQVKDLVSAGQRLSRLKKFPAVAEQIRGLLAPIWADFYSDPGGSGSLHQQDGDNGKSITDLMWGILDQAEEQARKRGRKAMIFNKYGYLAQVGESLNAVSVPPQPLPIQELSPQSSSVLVPPSPLPIILIQTSSPLPVAPPSSLPIPSEGSRNGDGYDDDNRGDRVNPQEIREVTRQIKKDLLPDIKRLIKQATKAGMQTETAKLNEVMNALNNTLAILSNPAVSNDDIRDFHDVRYWDTVSEIRALVELPKQIKDVEKQIRNITKLINSKSTKKAISLFGLDMAGVNSMLAETTQLLQEVKNSLQAGDPEGAQGAIRDVWDNNPEEIEGVIHRLRGFADMMRGIKNADFIAQLKALAQPGIDAFHTGDYREAQELFEGAGNDMQDLLNSVVRRSSW